jgi:hypothetical protein
MCGIFASFNKDTLTSLYNLNRYRGELNYSLSSFGLEDEGVRLRSLTKDSGKMPDNSIDKFLTVHGDYMIGHIQAPTSESSSIHPAQHDGRLLWHNGIIKQSVFKGHPWDTLWMLEQLATNGIEMLSKFDGTFACIMYASNGLFVFRNEISPMFVDDEMSISSTKFHNSRPLEPNVFFELNLSSRELIPLYKFTTKENPYYFGIE